MFGYDPNSFRPKGIDFKLNKSRNFYFRYFLKPFDIFYLINCSSSMKPIIENMEKYCINIANSLKNQMMSYDFKFGIMFYRDHIAFPNELNDYYDLTTDMNGLPLFIKSIMNGKKGEGDGLPKDWFSPYKFALKNIAWRKGKKLVIHFANT